MLKVSVFHPINMEIIGADHNHVCHHMNKARTVLRQYKKHLTNEENIFFKGTRLLPEPEAKVHYEIPKPSETIAESKKGDAK